VKTVENDTDNADTPSEKKPKLDEEEVCRQQAVTTE